MTIAQSIIHDDSETLNSVLARFNQSTPDSWLAGGTKSRRDLHGLIRYPAMMVPSMQADILDAILRKVGDDVHVVDPFVGSGTVLTEAMRRGLHFTGIDINPLAILTCEAKASIEAGISMVAAVEDVIRVVKEDTSQEIEVEFHKRDKWFEPHQAILFARFRRAILTIAGRAERQCLWVAFAETIRSCSRTRTSTYKLHIRPEFDVISEQTISKSFVRNLFNLLSRIDEYRDDHESSRDKAPPPELLCLATENANFEVRGSHCIVVTSPPYGDNRTTIPYGQFSYLALNWIPREDLPSMSTKASLATPAAIDYVSLGGSLKGAIEKTEKIEKISASARHFFSNARVSGKDQKLRKVGAFLWDYYESLKATQACITGPSHWVVTLGNRTSAEVRVPFDNITREILEALGGQYIESVERRLPFKRMPSRNNRGAMITSETTLVYSFG